MKSCFFLALSAFSLVALTDPVLAQTRKPAVTKGNYHGSSTSRARRARSGAYMAYSRANRRDEEDMKLAPGVRINMPTPPTTDYMGRPLKKKTKPVLGASTMSSEQPAAVPAKVVPTPRRRR